MKILRQLSTMIRRGLGMLTFRSSRDYWVERYQRGDDSGSGSYGALAQYKAEILNRFVAAHGVQTVIEYGCGDGNQLTLARYPQYTGFDISPDAIQRCRTLFQADPSKTFLLMSEVAGQAAELTLSLDVIYHLVEDAVFEDYMRLLFQSAQKYVAIYSTNSTGGGLKSPHVRHRPFTAWVGTHLPEWRLIERHPSMDEALQLKQRTSPAEFYFYQKTGVEEQQGS